MKDLESLEEGTLVRTRKVVVPKEYVNAARQTPEEGYSFKGLRVSLALGFPLLI